jgi:hypothetical protein
MPIDKVTFPLAIGNWQSINTMDWHAGKNPSRSWFNLKKIKNIKFLVRYMFISGMTRHRNVYVFRSISFKNE